MANTAYAVKEDIDIEIEVPLGQITRLALTPHYQQCAELQQKYDHLKQEKLDKDRDYIQSIEKQSQDLKKANQLIQTLTEQLKRKESDCSTLQAEKASLNNIYKQLESQNRNLQTEISNGKYQYEKLKKEKENADKTFHENHTIQFQKISDLTSEVGEMRRRNEEYQNEISSLKTNLASLKTLCEKQKSQFNQEKLAQNTNFNSLMKEKTVLSNQIEDKINEINTLQNENFELRSQNQQYIKQINELKQVLSENEIQIKAKDDLFHQLSTDFHQEKERLNNQLNAAQQENTQLTNEILGLKEKINQYQSGIANLVNLCLASHEDMMSGIPKEDKRLYWNQIRELSNSPYLYEKDRVTDFERISQFIEKRTELIKHQSKIIMTYQNKYISAQNNYRDFIEKSFSYFRRAHYCEYELLNACSSVQENLNRQGSITYQYANQINSTLTELFHSLYESTQKNGDDFNTFLEQSKEKLDSLPKQLDEYQNEINKFSIDYYNRFRQSIKHKIEDSSNQNLVQELIEFKFDICKDFENETKQYQTTFGNEQEQIIHRDDLPELQLNCEFDHQSTIENNQTYFGGIKTFLEQAKSSMTNLTGLQQAKEGANAQTEQMKQKLLDLEKKNEANEATILNLRTVLNLSARLCQQNYEDELEHHQQARITTTASSSRTETTKSGPSKNATDTATEPKAKQSDPVGKLAVGTKTRKKGSKKAATSKPKDPAPS